MGRARAGRAAGSGARPLRGWAVGGGTEKLCLGLGRGQNVARLAGGGVGLLAECTGGGARKFC